MSSMEIKLDPRRIINKAIMTKDNYPHSSVVGTTSDSIIVVEGSVRAHKYIIPKSLIVGFDGSYIHLSITESELSKYEQKI